MIRWAMVSPAQAFLGLLGAALLSVLPFASPIALRPVEAALDKPIWTADLRAYGDEHIEMNSMFNPFDRQTGVFFSDTGEVVAYFTTREAVPRLSRRGEPGQFRLRAVFLDGNTGVSQGVNDWPAELRETTLLPVAGGSLAFRSGSKVQLYSRDLTLINGFDLPEPERYESRYLRVSPDRKVLWLVRVSYRQHVSFIDRFDAASLAPLSKSEGETMGSTFTVSGDAIARSYPQVANSIVISQDGATWRTVLKKSDTWCIGNPLFVNNVQLLFEACGHVLLVSTAGEVLLDDGNFEKARHFEKEPAISRNGEFAAVSVKKTKGGAFDTAIRRSDTRIVVYDLLHKRRVWEVEVSPLPRFVYHFALSPDGSLLAVMVDSVIKVYKIPPPAMN